MEHVKETCEWLREAINLDKKCLELAHQDHDFDAIQEHDCFKTLLETAGI